MGNKFSCHSEVAKLISKSALLAFILGFATFTSADTGADKMALIDQTRQKDLTDSNSEKISSALMSNSSALMSESAVANVCEVVSLIQGPGDTEGLAIDEGNLWTSSDPYPYLEKIFKISSTTGTAISSFLPPGDGPKGLALVGTYLWSVDFLDDHIYKLTKSGSIVGGVDIHPSSGSYLALNSGIAWDGTGFWVTDWYSDFIYKISPDNGNVIDSFLSPLRSDPYGLAWDGKDLWVSFSEGIYKVDPTTGNILIECTSSEFKYGKAYGLTWDGEYLWGGSWISNEIMKISVPPSRYQPPTQPPPQKNSLSGIIFLLLEK